jgi:hypothetical protein
LLLGQREESRIGEKVAIFFTKPFQHFCPSLLTTPFETLVKAMIANTIYKSPEEPKSHVVFNDQIFKLAELYDQSK